MTIPMEPTKHEEDLGKVINGKLQTTFDGAVPLNHCLCAIPKKKYSTSGCYGCWTCELCGKFGGCDNRWYATNPFTNSCICQSPDKVYPRADSNLWLCAKCKKLGRDGIQMAELADKVRRKQEQEQIFTSVKDSGGRRKTDTGAVRDRAQGKGRYDLLSTVGIKRLALHYENGARKYADRNWEKGMPLSWFIDSALRHLFTYLDGDRSEDHMAAAAWNACGFMHIEQRIREGKLPKELDDIGATDRPLVEKEDACPNQPSQS